MKVLVKDKAKEHRAVKALKTLANLLPSESYVFAEKVVIKGSEALLTGLELTKKQKQQCKLNPDEEFMFQVPATNTVNHLRRLKKTYTKHGTKGVLNYMKPYVKKDRMEDVEKWINLQDI